VTGDLVRSVTIFCGSMTDVGRKFDAKRLLCGKLDEKSVEVHGKLVG
jgi:hypothetical protein